MVHNVFRRINTHGGLSSSRIYRSSAQRTTRHPCTPIRSPTSRDLFYDIVMEFRWITHTVQKGLMRQIGPSIEDPSTPAHRWVNVTFPNESRQYATPVTGGSPTSTEHGMEAFEESSVRGRPPSDQPTPENGVEFDYSAQLRNLYRLNELEAELGPGTISRSNRGSPYNWSGLD